LPEDVIAKNTAMSALSLRLARTDRICAAYLNVFRCVLILLMACSSVISVQYSGQLPELEPKSFEQRRLDLAKILNDYQKLVTLSLPGNLEDNMTWDEFSKW
jgi:hypothetical protein